MKRIQLQDELGKETKYINTYLNIIFNAKSLNRKKTKNTHKDHIYYENHHIIPISINPKYKNLKQNTWNGVLLTPREHFICHALIWKHYKSIDRKTEMYKMAKAFSLMSNKGMCRYNSKLYSRSRVVIVMSDEAKKRSSLVHIELHKNRTPEEIKIIGKKISEGHRKRKESMSKDEIEQEKLARKLFYENRTPEQKELRKEQSRQMFYNLSDEAKINKLKAIHDGHKVYMENKTDEDRKEITRKQNETRSKWSDEQKEEYRIASRERNLGSNSPVAIKVHVYDKDDNLKLTIHGGVERQFKELKLPKRLEYSYMNKGYRVHMIHPKNKHYGWYALKDGEEQLEEYKDINKFKDVCDKIHSESQAKAQNNKKINTYYIYNEKEELQYTVEGGIFRKFCEDNNLPFDNLKDSSKNEGRKLYSRMNNKLKEKLINNDWFQYVGWSCKKVIYNRAKKQNFSLDITIYDDKDDIIYSGVEYIQYCKDNNLPLHQLKDSYRKDGKRLYQGVINNINKANLKYKGWYAIKSKSPTLA